MLLGIMNLSVSEIFVTLLHSRYFLNNLCFATDPKLEKLAMEVCISLSSFFSNLALVLI